MGVDRAVLIADPGPRARAAAARAFQDYARRRTQREPVAYILGRKGFRRIELEVDPRVLIPRPETEHVVEAALDLPQGVRVVDVGTGSGAIALALADERPDLRVVGTDVSADALAVARANGGAARASTSSSAGGRPAGRRLRADRRGRLEPAVRRRRHERCRPRSPATSRPWRCTAATTGSTSTGAWRRPAPASRSSPSRSPGWQAEAVAGLLRRGLSDRGASATSPGSSASSSGGDDAFERCIAGGGVVVFPADTVYGLACDPETSGAVARLYELKGRPPDKPAAVMFFALAAPARARRRARAALAERLLPGRA